MFPFRSDYDEDEGTAKRRRLQKFIKSLQLKLLQSRLIGKEKKRRSQVKKALVNHGLFDSE